VRQALGASLSVLGRSVFVESLTLALCGGVLGVAVAVVLVPVLIAFSPADVFRLADASVNLRALLFAVSAAVVTALLCSLAPLLLLRRLSLEAFLRAGARGVVSGRSRLRSFLVVSEVAIALVLLIGAGLLFRSFLSMRAVPLGFEPAGLMSVSVGLPDEKPEVWRPFLTQVVERISGLPGVSSAASVTLRPLWGTVGMDWPFTVFGQTKEEAGRNPLTNLEAVSADYFRTMNIALRRGRAFTSADSSGAPGVVVVSESMARRYWPAADPLGQRLKIPLPGTPYHDAWLTVVGVAADARYRELRNSRLDLYMSFLQADHKPHHVVVRFSGDASTLADAIRRVVRSLDADQPVEEVVLMSSVVTSALGGPRFAAQLFSAFAGIALLLCGLGLYGLLSFSVSRRTREIGVRVAVGATPASVRRLVLREGLLLSALGIGVGLSGAAIGSRALSGLLSACSRSTRRRSPSCPPSCCWSRCWRARCPRRAPRASIPSWRCAQTNRAPAPRRRGGPSRRPARTARSRRSGRRRRSSPPARRRRARVPWRRSAGSAPGARSCRGRPAPAAPARAAAAARSGSLARSARAPSRARPRAAARPSRCTSRGSPRNCAGRRCRRARRRP
jgi:predicted permease